MFVREGMRNCANGRCCHLSVCVCRSGGKINSRHWNWFVVSLVNVYMYYWCVCRVFFLPQLSCFALLPTASRNPSWLSSQPTIHYFICSRCTFEDQARTNRRKSHLCYTTKHTQEELGGGMDVKGDNSVIEFKIKVHLRIACAYAWEYERKRMWPGSLLQSLWRDIRVFYLS